MKTLQEIRTSLDTILDDQLNIRLYLGVGRAAGRKYLRADIDQDAATTLCHQFVQGVRRYFADEDLATLELSNLDARADTLYFYDLADVPAEFAALGELAAGTEPDVFTFDDHSISDVKALVLKISSDGKSVTFFKQVFPVSIVKRDQILLTWSTDRFKVLKEDVLKIHPGFDVMLLDDEFYVADLKKFEAEFSFEAIAQKAMKEVAEQIVLMDIVDDVKGYLNNLDIPKRNVMRAKGSAVFVMEPQKILDFVAQHPTHGLKVVDGKIQLSSKNSIKFLFKLINEDILKSELTQVSYDSLAKNVFEGADAGDA